MYSSEIADSTIGQITDSEERFFGAVTAEFNIDTNEDLSISDGVSPRLFRGETDRGKCFVEVWEARREHRRSMTMWVERELQTTIDAVETAVVRSVVGSFAPPLRDGVGRQHPHRLLGSKRKRKRSR